MRMTYVFKGSLLFFIWLIAMDNSYAQKKKKRENTDQSPKQTLVYENKNYLDAIKTVQFYPEGNESQLPIYTLNTNERLLFSFDDLRGDVRTYFYSIEHCDINWQASRLTALEYAKGYNEDRIDNFKSSQGTFQKYTHYKFSFPNEYIAPLVAGNYLLKIYENADRDRIIATRRFYVVNPLIQSSAEVVPSLVAGHRQTHQKLNIRLRTALSINNPYQDIQIHVLQNQRPDNKMVLTKPIFVGKNEFLYNANETLDFLGNNEFRFVDLRSTRASSGRIKNMTVDSLVHFQLFTDEDNKHSSYASTFDENGRFYIRNLDYDQPEYQSDYADVLFTLDTDQEIQGDIYLVGGFNNFQRNPDNQLKLDKQSKLWTAQLQLKQGLYNYEYVVENKGKVETDIFSNSFFATGNDYQILVYCRRIGTYWDELLAVDYLSINNMTNNNQ